MEPGGTNGPFLKPLMNYLYSIRKKVIIFDNQTIEHDYALLCRAPILVQSLSTFSQTAGFINLALNPQSIQYIPFFPGDEKGINRYLSYKCEGITPVTIGGPFGLKVQNLRQEKYVPLEEMQQIYKDKALKAKLIFHKPEIPS